MKINPTYRGLLGKSVASLLSAIEIYNKPDFQYREETFAILAVNAWELLFKAHILKLNNYHMRSIYDLEPVQLKSGERSTKRKTIAYNRSGNPKTISIFTAIKILDEANLLSKNLIDNIESLIELRDNAVHFYNMSPIARPVQELGFACIKNYITILKKWSIPINLNQYNLYLMPLAYVDEQKLVDATLTVEQDRYIALLKKKLKEQVSNNDFDIAISIELDFKKGNSISALGVKYSEDGLPITLSEEDLRSRYPLTYTDVRNKCKERYSDFKCGKRFNEIMNEIKKNKKIALERKLDPNNPKSQKKTFYNGAVLKELDKYYTQRA